MSRVVTVTVICPDSMRGDANHLSMALGDGPADARTYATPAWRDADGNLYSVASLRVRIDWLQSAQQHLQRPAWDDGSYDVNMTGATRAQAAIILWQPTLDPVAEPESVPMAAPDILLAIAAMDPKRALAAAGLTRIESEP